MSSKSFDVIVAGASVAGSSAARQVAEAGLRVAVFEDDLEVGTPEKCGGLVSLDGLRQLGLPPSSRVIADSMKEATFTSPGGEVLKLDARKVGVVALRRRELDKMVAREAAEAGASFELGDKVVGFEEKDDSVSISTSSGSYDAKLFIDCRGVSVYKGFRAEGLLQAVQYECVIPDIERGRVEVLLDKSVTKEYFAWLIPLDGAVARVGVAGHGSHLQSWLEGYISRRGGKVIKKAFASLVVGGPLDKFVLGRRILAGDAAGQAKPTTAGGIFSGGVGGMMAGAWAARAISEGDLRILQGYEREWRTQFGKDFETQLSLRGLFVDLENNELDALFRIMIRENVAESLKNGSFDYHGMDFARMLGVKGLLESLMVLGRSYKRIRALVDLAQ
jgi:geranylgeranyl reductase family protein